MLTGNPPPTKHAHKIDSTALPVHFATSRKGHKRLTLQCEFRPSKQTPELHTVNFEPNDVRLKVSNTLFLATRCHAPIGFRSHKKISFEILLTVSYDITFPQLPVMTTHARMRECPRQFVVMLPFVATLKRGCLLYPYRVHQLQVTSPS